MHRRILIALLALASMLGAGAAAAAGHTTATPAPRSPLGIHASTVSQSGLTLLWRVSLDTPFAPQRLTHDGRSLCLLLQDRATGGAFGRVCVLAPAPGQRSARIGWQRVTAAGVGAAQIVDATLTRLAASELTVSFPAATVDPAYRTVYWQALSGLTGGVCAAATAPPSCVAAFPARVARAQLHRPQLVGCTATGPGFVTNGPGTGREIALTYDDGPWYQTAQFLSVLDHYHVPATFFEIGDQISEFGQHGAIERRMLADGDMIGDHTWTHPDVAGAGPFAAAQLEQTAAAIRAATGGFTPCLFRAPYGDVSPALLSEARSLGFTTIQWDIDPRDWALPGTGEIVSNVLANAHPGAIVIDHDGGGNRSETLAALPQIITALRARGYRFVTVTQLLGLQLIYR